MKTFTDKGIFLASTESTGLKQYEGQTDKESGISEGIRIGILMARDGLWYEEASKKSAEIKKRYHEKWTHNELKTIA